MIADRNGERSGEMFDSMSGAMATVLSDAMGITTGVGLAREIGRGRMSAEQPVARLLGTARKRDGMVVRTVAGLPVAIGGDTRAPGFSRATRVVRTTGAA
jgi:hypothetical protein